MLINPNQEEHIKQVDAQYWSPQERAMGVHNLIRNLFKEMKENGEKTPSEFDLMCHAIEYIGMHALGIGDRELIEMARRISLWLYSVHYTQIDKIVGKPENPDREGLKKVPEGGSKQAVVAEAIQGTANDTRQAKRNRNRKRRAAKNRKNGRNNNGL